MPVKRVLNADLESVVAALEEDHQRIIQVSESGPGACIVVYEAKVSRSAPGERETREVLPDWLDDSEYFKRPSR